MTIRGSTVFTACLMVCFAMPTRAGELAGVTLPGRTTAGKSTLVLNGMGLREVTWLRINVYVAGLYLETRSSDADAILGDDHPKRIVLLFVRSVGRRQIIHEWDESLRANVGQDFASLEERVATLHGWLPDTLSRGDEISLSFLPGEGLVVEIGGVVKGTIPGADFARAVFAVWLGPRPPDRDLRAGLLGCGRG